MEAVLKMDGRSPQGRREVTNNRWHRVSSGMKLKAGLLSFTVVGSQESLTRAVLSREERA